MDKGCKGQVSAGCVGAGLVASARRGVVAAVCAMLCVPLAALPGVHSALQDVSGEYVWYEDNTFKRTSYVGFVYYDEGTYAARYYAPQDAAAGLAEKAIDVYVTVKRDSEHLEMTGEKVVGASADGGDIAIVNYIHDLFYDFTARRQDAGDVSAASGRKRLTANCVQFGDDALLEFDALVPLWGLRTVTGADGKVMFRLVTVGRLTSAEDTSFANFHGLSDKYTVGKADKGRKAKIKTKAKSVVLNCGDVHFTLDGQWVQKMDNMWVLGDNAMMTAAEIAPPTQGDKGAMAAAETAAALARRLPQSSGDTYVDWRNLRMERGDRSGRQYIRLDSISVPSDGSGAVRTFRLVEQQKGGEAWCVLTLTVFDGVYQTHHDYFDKIASSF